jgi:hypothetical protein
MMSKTKIDILDKIEIETLLRDTLEYLNDDELNEMAIQAAGWGKKSIEKFGKTIGADPKKHGFVNTCIKRMEGKKGWDKEKAGGFCASIVDRAKGTTKWREGSRKKKEK